MEVVLTIVLAILGSTGVSTVVVACLNRKWSKQDNHDERMDAMIGAQKVLMVDRVRHLGQSYIYSNQITLESKENLIDMYNAYKKLGGNGHLDTIIAEVEKLPIIDK